MDELEKIGDIISKIDYKNPDQLAERIILLVEKKDKKSARIWMWIYSGGLTVSAVLLYFTAHSTISELNSSGAYGTFSLLFSDFQVVVSNLNYFLLSLAESLPVMPIIYLLLTIMAMISLAGLVINNLKKVSQNNNIYNNFKYAKHI
jgi:hypothetical protein